MKINGAELQQFMDTGWPGLDEGKEDDWYWDHDVFDAPLSDATYDTRDIGPIMYQGSGEDPSPHGDGYDLGKLIKDWRKKRDSDVVTVLIPKDKTEALVDYVALLGGKIL
jgi:hypothetical protein